MTFRINQEKAIQASIKNDFKSGVHFHATGTGKSWIGLQMIIEYNKRYPKNNIIWLCEQKSILVEQFDTKCIKERGFSSILKEFHILNYTQRKQKDWYNSINVSKFWNKPVLIIINRAFLTSSDKYMKIQLPIHLVVHDECHSIQNKTTQQFYNYMLSRYQKDNISCIGFSATPNLNIKPFKNILSKYSIYDAYCDKVIVPPKIKWFQTNQPLEQLDILLLVKKLIVDVPYKKVILWCGMIQKCVELANLWKQYFPNFMICVDTSQGNSDYKTYQDFEKLESNGLLFCAGKHREGSDIKNLDTCVFLDKVEERNSKKFVQCVGRVLRLDKNNSKKYGLIIDAKAKNCIKICDRMNQYLKCDASIFPWDYQYQVMQVNSKSIQVNTLNLVNKNKNNDINALIDLVKNDSLSRYQMDHLISLVNKPEIKTCLEQIIKNIESKQADTIYNNQVSSKGLETYKSLSPSVKLLKHAVGKGDANQEIKRSDLTSKFVRNIQNDEKYEKRLEMELDLIEKKELIPYLLQSLEILKMTRNIPHVTRGSCGSSLVCYLLGISHVDPLKYDIKFARFLNEFRDTLPDIDFDFPYHLRDEVFLKLQLKWPGKIARISNHVYYHKKSALRKALRLSGHRKFIPKNDINKVIHKFEFKKQKEIYNNAYKLENTFNTYSLHCGGIVYYPEGVPKKLILSGQQNNVLNQINLNKKDVAKENKFKIDILSSRGLAQLYECNNYSLINFERFLDDSKTKKMLENGFNIGLTLAESPLMRKAMLKVKPKNVHDIAICLSIIRPAAREARKTESVDYNEHFVFDDDAITIISKILKCSDNIADKYRRLIAKKDKKTILEIKKVVSRQPSLKPLYSKLKNLQKYSFCKSHAYSYAQLVWQLAYMKANYPKQFWNATLNHCQSSYRKWVHYYEARSVGVEVSRLTLKRNDTSIYAETRKKKFFDLTQEEQLRKYGYWNMETDDFYPNCFYNIISKEGKNYIEFDGLIASHRFLTRYESGRKITKITMFFCVASQQYYETLIDSPGEQMSKYIGVKGSGYIEDSVQKIIKLDKYELY